MLRIGKESSQNPKDVLTKATTFFGPGGVGLNVIPRGPHTLEFTGGGGFVLLQAEPQEDDEGSEIEIQTREWDYQVKRFLQQC